MSQPPSSQAVTSPDDTKRCRDCGKPAVRKGWFWYVGALIGQLVVSGPDPRTPFCRDCRNGSVAFMIVVGIMLIPFFYIVYLKAR
ncbi:MAG: hypothetical protein ACOY3E_14280 [Pseudomonadota bacterium]